MVGVKTFLKNMEQATGMEITRDDVPAIRAYVEPPADDARLKAIENTSPYMLHPKSGNLRRDKGNIDFHDRGYLTDNQGQDHRQEVPRQLYE